jgi:putative oxidoreductase
MKIVTLIARILLGLVFLVFGLNGFLNFLNTGPAPTGLAGQFLGALILSHYYWVVAALQIAGGALLLVNRFVPLALVLLGPVIVNIICFHVFMNPMGAPPRRWQQYCGSLFSIVFANTSQEYLCRRRDNQLTKTSVRNRIKQTLNSGVQNDQRVE